MLRGSATNAKFAATGTTFELRMRELKLDARSGTQLVFDFDLERFPYKPTTGLVTLALQMPRPAEAFQKFVRQFAEAQGTVKAVDLAAQTLIVDVRPAVSGIPPAPVTGTVRGEGKVVPVSGSLVTVAVKEANTLPGSNTVMLEVGQARFSHGQDSDLAASVKVEFAGTVSGTGVAARIAAARVQVQGAATPQEREKSPLASFAALEGQVSSAATDGRFVVAVKSLRGPGAMPGTSSLTVDPKNAIDVRGQGSCLAAGREVDVLGTVSACVLQARLILVEGCTGQEPSGG